MDSEKIAVAVRISDFNRPGVQTFVFQFGKNVEIPLFKFHGILYILNRPNRPPFYKMRDMLYNNSHRLQIVSVKPCSSRQELTITTKDPNFIERISQLWSSQNFCIFFFRIHDSLC